MRPTETRRIHGVQQEDDGEKNPETQWDSETQSGKEYVGGSPGTLLRVV